MPAIHGTGRTPIDRIALFGELGARATSMQLLADADDQVNSRMRRALVRNPTPLHIAEGEHMIPSTAHKSPGVPG